MTTSSSLSGPGPGSGSGLSFQIYRLDPPGAAVVEQVKSTFDPGVAVPPRPGPSSPRPTLFFHDALAVRWKVFIDEQKCGWEPEVDADDTRSWHFSALTPGPGAKSETTTETGAGSDPKSKFESGSDYDYDATTLATLRIVPGPHAPHPHPGSVDFEGGTPPDPARVRPGHRDATTAMHDGHELYAKVGRLATAREARGRGVARRLIEHALAWAVENAEKLDRPAATAAAAVPGETEADDTGRVWKGLVLAHAQVDVIPMYAKCGFAVDEELGTWIEEGISHVAMWRRVKIPGRH